jgi:hypothetical protein
MADENIRFLKISRKLKVLFTFAKEFSMTKFRENSFYCRENGKRHFRFNTRTTLQRPNTENSKQIFPGKEQL